MPLHDWLLSKSGQKIISGLVITAAGGSAGFYTLSNTYFLDQYQSFLQMYRNGAPLEVDPDVMKLVDKVLADCPFTEPQRSAFSFFTVLGLDTFHIGSTKLNCGARIGIPRNFTYRRTADIEREDLMIGGGTTEPDGTVKPFSFNSEPGRAILDSLVLSDQARRFAIARDIHAGNTNYVYTRAALSTIAIMMTYNLGRFINQRLNLYKTRRFLRSTLHSVTFAFGLVTYLMLYDATELAYERNADQAVSKMGAEYAAGAVEYYEKQLARNKALRVALGKEGKDQYTVSGNVEVALRTRSTPLTVRLDQAREFMEEWAEKSRTAAATTTPATPNPTPTPTQKQEQKK